MVDLSIIVPIYNVENYLCSCIDSLINQDCTDDKYEVILVDDGSTDGSATIADQYASLYDNIKVFHQTNKGLGAARNAGIAKASGKYIQFVDSDDYLEPDVLGTLIEKMNEDELDVLRFNYQNVNERHEVFNPYKDINPYVDMRDVVCDGLTFLNERLGYACYAVQFIVRKGLLVENGIFFKEGIYYEDVEWTPRMLLAASQVTSVDIVVYNYLLRKGSITDWTDEGKTRKRMDDAILVNESLLALAGSVPDSRWFHGYVGNNVASLVTSLSLVQNLDFVKDYLKKLLAFRPLSIYRVSERSARKIKLINISPYLFVAAVRLKEKIR